MIKYLRILLIFQILTNNLNYDFYTFHVLINNKSVNNGYIHFLSNDELINEISIIGLDMEEKHNKQCKIDKNGFLKISKKLFQKKYNINRKDSIYCIVRCGSDLGVFNKIKITNDTIKINIIQSKQNNCFFSN